MGQRNEEESGGGEGVGERGEEEEENVWSRYPEELHMAILKRLPWMDKLRLRRVCVLWNAILRDPSLLRDSRQPEGALHFCCLTSAGWDDAAAGDFQLYTPIGGSWQKFTSMGNFKVVAAAAGLLLMQREADWRRTLILINPLNRSQRQLPLPPELEDMATFESCVFEMTPDGDDARILAGVWRVSRDDGSDGTRNPHLRHWHGWKFFVYDLRGNAWRVVADLRLRDEGHAICALAQQLPSVTLVGDDLFLLSTFHGTSSRLYRVRAAAPEQCTRLGAEQDLAVGGGAALPPSSSYVESRLLESAGRLLLVLRQSFRLGKAADADDFGNNFWELSVYEFDFASSEWKPALRLPPALARSRSFAAFDGDGDVLCFHNDNFTGLCDLVSGLWRPLPPPAIDPNGRSCAPMRNIFLFQPRLDVIL